VVSRSIGAGYLVGGGLFPDIRVWPALLHAAELAPTDDLGKDSPLIKGNERASGVVALFDTASVPHSWVTVDMRSLPVFGAAAVRVEAQRRTIRV
jgi:hypothetical protein